MDRILLYEDTNKYLRIIYPNPKFQQPSETEHQALERLTGSFLPEVTKLIVCRPNKVPSEPFFRDAWRLGDESEPIKFDFALCLEIHRKRIQEAADKKIEQLSKELEIALENENTPQAVAIRRTNKILRTFGNIDLTHCKTIEDIKYSIPRELHDVWSLYPPTR